MEKQSLSWKLLSSNGQTKLLMFFSANGNLNEIIFITIFSLFFIQALT